MVRLNCNIISNFRSYPPSIIEKIVEQLHIAIDSHGDIARKYPSVMLWEGDSISRALYWEFTPQGGAFWSEVDRGLLFLALERLHAKT